MRANGPLTLDIISDALLSEFGLSRGCYAARESYQCEAHGAIMIALSQLFVPPALKMNEERLRWVLRGFRDNRQCRCFAIQTRARLPCSTACIGSAPPKRSGLDLCHAPY